MTGGVAPPKFKRLLLKLSGEALMGDLAYGADPTLAKRLGLNRQWLHAVRLGFEHPESGEHVEYESTYPDDLAAALEIIRDSD